MERWTILRKGADFERIGKKFRISPRLACLIRNRDIVGDEEVRQYLYGTLADLYDGGLMKDMDRAVRILKEKIQGKKKIRVIGDYDSDGVNSAYILSSALKRLGADADTDIPDRMKDGYGLNVRLIEKAHEDGIDTILTCDNGIAAKEEIRYGKSLGMTVIVTDHHEVPFEEGDEGKCFILPPADAVVDPKREDCPYPFPELAGVGVALKTAQALVPAEARPAVFRRFGELAAIGTVADVMRLTDENRALVRQGLELLARTERPGLRALLAEAGLEPGAVPTAVTIGYGLAPRINAAGRMEQAMVALELLLTRDEARGNELAQALCALNRERQAIELEIYQQCEALLEANPQMAEPCIVLAGRCWHQGVVGIVASRLAEKYACPAFMISLENGLGKASCRSFGGFHLFAALERCVQAFAQEHGAPLFEAYGGHEMAAGFTIREENIPAFQALIRALVSDYAGGRPMEAAVDVDAEIEHCGRLTVPEVESLSALEPFGAGNPKPVLLLRGACVLSCCDVGGGRHLKMKLRRDGVVLDAIFFSANAAACGVAPGGRLDVIFTPQINEFRGSRTVQLQLCDLRPAPTRARLEQELFQRLKEGADLSRWEAGLLLPSRQDFARLWRFLEHSCAGDGVDAGPALLRQAARQPDGRCAYGRTLVCLHVMGDRGLIQMESRRLRLCRPEHKVDLEQADMMRRLRLLLEEEP